MKTPYIVSSEFLFFHCLLYGEYINRSGFSNALISLYKTLIEQLDRKDEQIVNLQKIIYNKDTRLLELTDKKSWCQFWK